MATEPERRWLKIDARFEDGRCTLLTLDGVRVDDPDLRRWVLGDRIVDRELIPERLWKQ